MRFLHIFIEFIGSLGHLPEVVHRQMEWLYLLALLVDAGKNGRSLKSIADLPPVPPALEKTIVARDAFLLSVEFILRKVDDVFAIDDSFLCSLCDHVDMLLKDSPRLIHVERRIVKREPDTRLECIIEDAHSPRG